MRSDSTGPRNDADDSPRNTPGNSPGDSRPLVKRRSAGRRAALAAAGASAGLVAVVGLHPAHLTTISITGASSRATAGSGGSVRRSSASGSSGAAGARSAVGSLEQFAYGQFAVRVSVDGTRVVALDVVGLQAIDSFSTQLDAKTFPKLEREVLAAQKVNVQAVSTATYTSLAYLSSVQAAIDKLHVH